MKTRVCPEYFVNGFLWKQYFSFQLTPDPFNLNFVLFSLSFALLAKCFSDLYIEVEI